MSTCVLSDICSMPVGLDTKRGEGVCVLTNTAMMHMVKKQPSKSKPYLPIRRDTVFVTPMAPSPMTIKVSRLMRSIKCVFLKLNILQTEDIVITAADSTSIIIYQTMYTRRWETSPSLNAGVMAANAPTATRYSPIMKPMGRYNLENFDRTR